jgi:hypothetical protein
MLSIVACENEFVPLDIQHFLDDEGAPREMPLTHTEDRDAPGMDKSLFAGARAPDAAKAGLLLRLGCWSAAHQVVQDLETPEAYFWHGIVHRQEPDAGNASYWFGRVGQHAIFGGLREDAMTILAAYPELGWKPGATWDPLAFIDWCEEARQAPGSPGERAAIAIQAAEWKRLFEWCAGI